jgi:signal transduction histidine kinase
MMNKLDLLLLLFLSWLSGVFFTAWSNGLITTRKISLVWGVFIVTVLTVFARHSNTKVVSAFLHSHTTDIKDKQLADLQEAHRKRVSFLKNEFAKQHRGLERTLNRMHMDYERLNHEYDFMAEAFQEGQRTILEQDDRIAYLEGLRGRATPMARAPFSAPSNRIQFSNPPRRTRGTSRGGGVVLAPPSPLSQVMGAGEGEL